MMIKYRVHEVAKDLNVPSKDVIELLGKHFDTPKKHMTALTEEELTDIVRFACTAAGLSTTRPGGISSIPTLSQVEALL